VPGPGRHPSICRICSNFCSVEVETTAGGRIARIDGNRDNPIYGGYRCTKGVNQRHQYDDPERLLHSLKNLGDGRFARIPIDEAIGEIAGILRETIDRHGPRALGLYSGSYLTQEFPGSSAIRNGFMRAVGSPMVFDAATLDQSGKHVARGLHGVWMAPDRSLQAPGAALMVGTNPMVSHMGRLGPPAQLLKDFSRWGTKLIVVDPRRTELARKAALHLQARPGEDVAVVAGIIRLVLEDRRHDQAFVDQHVHGFGALAQAVDGFTAERVAARADIAVEDLRAAARIFGDAEHAYANAGTGPNMGAKGTLVEYLLLALNTVTGQWSRAGDLVPNPTTSLPAAVDGLKAQAGPPFPAFGLGDELRVRGLHASIAGPPTAALAEEILTEGTGRCGRS
jgi:anaerobic selenocysteine-containing dehydrogenase